MFEIYRKWTATNLFLTPLLGIGRANLDANGFENAYIKDEIKGIDYENAVYLLFRPMNQERFEEFLSKERSRKAKIIDEYDYPDGYTMVVYQYDPKWQFDIEIIMSGKFSKVSTDFKESIPKTGRKVEKPGVFKEITTIQHQIFKKDLQVQTYWKYELGLDFEKDDEIWPIYFEKEIFSQDTLEKLIKI